MNPKDPFRITMANQLIDKWYVNNTTNTLYIN